MVEYMFLHNQLFMNVCILPLSGTIQEKVHIMDVVLRLMLPAKQCTAAGHL